MAIREEVATINGRRSDGHNITRQIQEQDNLRLKLAPLEQSGNRWGEEHRPSLSGQASKLATLPT